MYKCYYEITPTSLQTYVIVCELGDVKDGFWINKKDNFTKGSDAFRWIPPHCINWVDKC